MNSNEANSLKPLTQDQKQCIEMAIRGEFKAKVGLFGQLKRLFGLTRAVDTELNTMLLIELILALVSDATNYTVTQMEAMKVETEKLSALKFEVEMLKSDNQRLNRLLSETLENKKD